MASRGWVSLSVLVAAVFTAEVLQVTAEDGNYKEDPPVNGTIPVPIPVRRRNVLPMVIQMTADEKNMKDLPVNDTIPVPIPVQYVSRIIGGKPTSTQDFPWQVYISTGTSWCGASIISTSWILSAAHCFANGDPDILADKFVVTAKRISIVAGLTKRSQKDSDPDVQIRTINEDEIEEYLFIHPEFKKGAWLNNDIALIKLENPLTLSEKVQPINLAETSDFIPGKELITSGWGRTSDNGFGGSDILQYVDGLSLISKEECRNAFGIYVTDKNLCQKTENKNICNGDSGGPLITGIGSSNGPPYVQIGINGFVSGYGCEAHQPSAFTDVTSFKYWINSTISGLTTPIDSTTAASTSEEDSTTVTIDPESSTFQEPTSTIDPITDMPPIISIGEFMSKFNKTYENESEKMKRIRILQENMEKIKNHNKLYEEGNSSFLTGVNEYSDLTYDEVIRDLTGDREPNISLRYSHSYYTPKDIGQEPSFLDYRQWSAVNPIRNQRHCGSCWAFSAISTIESNLFLKWGILPQLSEQELVDCDTASDGCDGGYKDKAIGYVIDHGISYRKDYPYTVQDGTCNDDKAKTSLKVKSLIQVAYGSDADLLNALVHIGPIAVSIFVSDNFNEYKAGVLEDDLCANADRTHHAVVLVGYGTENGKDYWLIRNSWGETWGEKGYVKLSRNIKNHCRISTFGFAPVIERGPQGQVGPEGYFGLPKTKDGCPSPASQWLEGGRYHDAEDYRNQNSWSDPIHLEADLGHAGIKLNFCLKKYSVGSPWPAGNYCIHKYRDACPQGFGQGYIYWDDEDSNNANNKYGTLPSGQYDRNTRYDYCCRNDGNSRIHLPFGPSFFLYPYTSGCQEVIGMRSRMEWVYWDNEDDDNASSKGGVYPKVEGGTNYRLYYCYYYL